MSPHTSSNIIQRGRIFPLSGLAATSKLPPGVPSLRQLTEAGVIKINEVPIPTPEGGEGENRASGSKRKGGSKEKEKGKEGPDWLALAAREVLGEHKSRFQYLLTEVLVHSLRLVDLKFITGNQTIEFTYEGTPRRFVVQSITPKGSQPPKGDADALSQELTKLSLEGDSPIPQPKSQIWSTGWDCSVNILDGSERIAVEDPQVLISLYVHYRRVDTNVFGSSFSVHRNRGPPSHV